MFSIEFEQMIQINFVILLFSTIFVNEAESQEVDTSIALLWTTTDSIFYSVFGIWYGDPESYVPIFAQNQSSVQNYSIFTVSDSNFLPTYHAVNADVLSNQIFISDYYLGKVYAFPDAVNPLPSSITYSSISAALPVSKRITGLATDWLSRNLYWTDMTNKQIGLTSLANTRYWRPVINTKLASVQHLVIHANLSLIFWCDVGSTPKIERSDLLGNNRTVLVNSTKVHLTYPTKLGIDFLYERLCWLDSQATLFGCTDYEGSVVKTFTLAILQSTSSFVIYKRYVYFGSGTVSSITIAEMQSSQQLKIITTRAISSNGLLLSKVIDMTMFSSYGQQGSSPCMVDNGGCSHICVATSPSTRDCQCSVGYFLDPDGISCLIQMLSENFLLLSDTLQRTIYQVELSTGEIHVVGYFASASPASFDYDPTEQTLYWVDRSTATNVWRTSLSDQTQTLIYSTYSSITSLAVDVYYGRKIYFASSGSGRIQEMDLDGTLTRTILLNSSSTPSAIVVDFYNRLLYFSECTTRTIQTIDLDNISNRNILQSGLLYCVQSMAIDFSVQLLYFGDSSGQILMSDFSGSNRRAIYLVSSAIFYGLAIDSNYVYIAYNNGQYLTKINRTSTVATQMTSVVFVQPYSVIIPSLPGPNRTSTTTTQTTTTTTTTTTSTTTSTTTTTPTTTTTSTTTTTTTPPTSATTTTTTLPPPTTTTTTTTTPSSATTTQIPSTPSESTNLKSPAQSSSAGAADSSTVTIIVVVVVVGGIIFIAVIITVGFVVYKKRRTGAATNQFEDRPKPENVYDNIAFDASPYYTQLKDCSSTDPVFEKPEKGDVADDDEGVKFEEIGDGIYL